MMPSGLVLLSQSCLILSASLNTPRLTGKSEICAKLSQIQYQAVQQYSKISFVIRGVKQCCYVALEWTKRSRCVNVLPNGGLNVLGHWCNAKDYPYFFN